MRSAAAGERTIVGVAAVFNVDTTIGGRFVERIAPGAFRESLDRGDDVVALFNHEASRVLGRRSSTTLRVWVDDVGLRYEIQANPRDPDAAAVLAKIARGDVTGSSFQFEVLPGGDEITFRGDGMPVRTLLSVRLIDVSPVTFPAYAGTSTSARARGRVEQQIRDRVLRTHEAHARLQRAAAGSSGLRDGGLG